MEYSAKELLEQLKGSKIAYIALSAELEKHPDDAALAYSVDSMDDHIKRLVRELRLYADEPTGKELVADESNSPVVRKLSEAKTFFHLIGYYVTNGLKNFGEGITALKRDMKVLNVIGETKITAVEELTALEDAALFGYWRMFYDDATL